MSDSGNCLSPRGAYKALRAPSLLGFIEASLSNHPMFRFIPGSSAEDGLLHIIWRIDAGPYACDFSGLTDAYKKATGRLRS